MKTTTYMIGDRVLIIPEQTETMSKGGLYIPDAAKEKPQRGHVVSVGPGTKDYNMSLKVDDVVMYGKYAGTEIIIAEEKFLIMQEKDVLMVIKETIDE